MRMAVMLLIDSRLSRVTYDRVMKWVTNRLHRGVDTLLTEMASGHPTLGDACGVCAPARRLKGHGRHQAAVFSRLKWRILLFQRTSYQPGHEELVYCGSTVVDDRKESPALKELSIVREFPNVFPTELPEMLPD
uniref:Uncharacterized protein n=1 Tax=Ananas comosus var. bracteatus TaxID=296719 RepID=A0A6V7PQC3_ANACO|nr:unnamed protein product [Ananas comosus var. bracteatus]